MENQESSVEQFEFKPGDRVKEKSGDDRIWTILGITDEKVRLVKASEGAARDITKQELVEKYELTSEESDPLLREFEELVK